MAVVVPLAAFRCGTRHLTEHLSYCFLCTYNIGKFKVTPVVTPTKFGAAERSCRVVSRWFGTSAQRTLGTVGIYLPNVAES